jgi:colanic acid biosynthesis glycosyl transferase WcaI
MKILIYGINYSPELTGVGKYTSEMSEWLASRRHQVEVIAAVPYYPEWTVGRGYHPFKYKCEVIGGVKVWHCPILIPKKINFLGRILLLLSFSFTSFPILVYKVIMYRPRLIWVVEPSFFCAVTTLIMGKLARRKIWLHIQDFEIDAVLVMFGYKFPWIGILLRNFEGKVMNGFDVVSTISNGMMSLLIHKGVSVKKIVLFPNWVDTKKIKPSLTNDLILRPINPYRIAFNLPAESIVVLYSGNIGEKQGLDIVVKSAQNLLYINSIKFIICGAGAGYSKLKKSAEGLSNVYWLPLQPLERLNDLLNVADIHLLPQLASYSELVMPSKLLGIFASGRPVIASSEMGTALYEAVNGKGINVNPGDCIEFSNAIKHLSENAQLRSTLGANARNYALLNFDKEIILNTFEANVMKFIN